MVVVDPGILITFIIYSIRTSLKKSMNKLNHNGMLHWVIITVQSRLIVDWTHKAVLILFFLKIFTTYAQENNTVPKISNLTYDEIAPTHVTIFWTTDIPADSKILFMPSDSNDQPLLFTDSVYLQDVVETHAVLVDELQPATIYKYLVVSRNIDGSAVDSGYFITQSESSGEIQVYFNHTVDTSVNTGEYANGNQNFATLLKTRINQASHSIDITLFEFSYYTDIATALIQAKERGVKIRFIYNHSASTPQLDSLIAHGIPVIKRNYDTLHSMHNKFIIFDYRFNANPFKPLLWNGSTNLTHAQLHSDRNNVITVQDEALCAVYTREFEEMWGSHTDVPDTARARFGTQKTDNIPHILNVAGTRTEVYFTPSDGVAIFLEDLILTQTTNSIYFCMLKANIPEMENILHTIFNNGISVKGVFDLSNSMINDCIYPRMKGLPVMGTWDPPADVFTDPITGLIHHKYFILNSAHPYGNKIISTGSFNWEISADSANDDNSLTLFSDRITNLFLQEFCARYEESGGENIGMAIEEQNNPLGPILLEIFPNPFTYWTTIRYELDSEGPVYIYIFDVMGRETACMIPKWQEPGLYEIHCDLSQFREGVYSCRLVQNGHAVTQKLLLLR
jgi:hypothetical protein